MRHFASMQGFPISMPHWNSSNAAIMFSLLDFAIAIQLLICAGIESAKII
jgi:hypothetical protein